MNHAQYTCQSIEMPAYSSAQRNEKFRRRPGVSVDRDAGVLVGRVSSGWAVSQFWCQSIVMPAYSSAAS